MRTNRESSKGLVIAAMLAVTITVAAPCAAGNPAYPVVDTGQDRCYHDSREIACPVEGAAFFRQDAQYQGLQPAYRDNGDGTVSDLNTGLM